MDLIHEGLKYELIVTRSSPNSYHIILNDTAVNADTHKLSDGGLLISYDGMCGGQEERPGLSND